MSVCVCARADGMVLGGEAQRWFRNVSLWKGDRRLCVGALGAEFALLFVSDKQPPRASRPSAPARGGPPAEPPSSS